MRTRSVPARRGLQWIVDGFWLFRKSPFMWIALTLVLAVLWMLMFMVRVVGPLLFNLFSPVFFAGLMIGCKDLEEGRELELRHIFAGFRQRPAPLVTLGGVYLVGMIIVVGLIFMAAAGTPLAAVLSGKSGNVDAAVATMQHLALALTLSLALYVPLLMLVWFAPLLVVFHGLDAVPAMKLSFQACWRNMMPFTVYGLVILALWFIATIPFLLGLFVVLPVLFCSIYASYKDCFEPDAPPAQTPVNGEP